MAGRHRILVVDDSRTNLLIVREMLEDQYDLVTVLSGEEALAVMDAFRPDLILLDIMMPTMDGYEVCRRVRARPELGDVRIIIVSACAMEAERQLGLQAGADDYVTKPFDCDDLFERIRSCLGERASVG